MKRTKTDETIEKYGKTWERMKKKTIKNYKRLLCCIPMGWNYGFVTERSRIVQWKHNI